MSTSTQFATSVRVESPRSPPIPPEIVSLILSKLWDEPLSSEERSASLKNIVLVNRTWLTLVAPIASRDVHIFDEASAVAFIGRIRHYPFHEDLFSSEASRFTTELCRSLTFHVNGHAPRRDPSIGPHAAFYDGSVMAAAISSVLCRTSMCRHEELPNLRHLALRYTDWTYDDVLQQMWLQHFPAQLTRLSLEYAFTAPASAPALESATIVRWARREHRCAHPNIRHLAVSGATPAFAAAFVRTPLCPNIETLEIAHPAQLAALVPLPPPLRTLVLGYPGVAVSRDTMASWALDAALDAGLFSGEGERPRVVLRSGTPDPIAFIALRCTCKRFDVDLVYERDDARGRPH